MRHSTTNHSGAQFVSSFLRDAGTEDVPRTMASSLSRTHKAAATQKARGDSAGAAT
eukprot:CAMPEP_0118918922 /NCGR_PEP_ID=MMETSP1166-20130328/18234_1 /TAXON_ID=1104430 /ORGANISM="Chrysoreinhardia sp, Strain CCMP3193" /LENGTH=55 /DNA_ID=CAMNT_0006859347 /DNA_START=229 /DNA_END=393 /DNA_ORIENTATION=-